MKATKKLVVGILAHVDAGKTTLAESLLYKTGSIRKMGRVDHQDAFLDTDAMEKARGITIFSKQARFDLGEYEITLLDTPGHVDFSAEMERTLQVLDYAVLVISGADGVQGHVETLWRLLARYRIPVFLFVNKMDQPGTDADRLMQELQDKLDKKCVAFSTVTEDGAEKQNAAGSTAKNQSVKADKEGWQTCQILPPADFMENVAVCDDQLLERYLEGEEPQDEDIAVLIVQRKIFPCFFGSALKVFGVEELLKGLYTWLCPKQYPEQFGARVFKISRDEQGKRLTHMKITGGSLKAKMLLTNRQEGMESEQIWEEKADQLRLYSGASFVPAAEASAGMICAVTGLTQTFAGQGFGIDREVVLPVLEPVLTYRIELPEDDVKSDPHSMYMKLKQLEEEEPELSVIWQEESREIHAQVMGDVQMEILKNQIKDRFGVTAEFGEGSIVYKETIADKVEGVGHFEPLRHYAEVHLILEPLERGAGLQFAADVSEDVLDRNWQRLVLTHLEEKKHKGVLVGGEITDMKITLADGRAHLKHTEGGDFRQATYRAVRHGLMNAESVLLEPVYAFTLEVPSENIGRAMTDIQKMQGSFGQPSLEGEFSVLKGKAPVAAMSGYQREVTAYTKGRGKLNCVPGGYEVCHNAEEVIEKSSYDPEADLKNPTGSVFCAHGAGFVVPWYEVEEYMHLESCLAPKLTEEEKLALAARQAEEAAQSKGRREVSLPEGVSNEELEEIFARTYHANKKERYSYKKKKEPPTNVTRRWSGLQNAAETQRMPGQKSVSYYSNKKNVQDTTEYLLVDGYNIIFAWEDLRELAAVNIESARNKLMDILSNYQGFHKCVLILVFDAYRVEGGVGSVMKYHNIDVVFTKEAETADQYIEKTAHKLGRENPVTVATSDALEQVIIYGQGARRLSARELLEEVEFTKQQIREVWRKKHSDAKNYLFDHLPEDMVDMVEDVRLGLREFGEE
ncbi:MAG: TetM/TetW/TetO/TetS family tetracycline resistance ribosomal protection protein [Lachnospiraceae bacterium]|nr:TetM/TetW/TetO/TetS family tetracycline resistance ribosomal protection protein [Lachnospiraceae bacterium]